MILGKNGTFSILGLEIWVGG